jgi:hypothetical protein
MMEILRETFSAFYRLKQFIPKREEQKIIWQHHREVYGPCVRVPRSARRDHCAYGFRRATARRKR